MQSTDMMNPDTSLRTEYFTPIHNNTQHITTKRRTNSARSSNTNTTANPGEQIQVLVRVRPLSQAEASADSGVVLCCVDGNTVELNEGGGKREYRFNRAVGVGCGQTELFQLSQVKDLLEAALDGYASTVIAYGQTGSGKTYSMSGLEEKIVLEDWSGDDDTNGIIPRSMEYLFQNMRDHRVKASYCEIYNEQVFDLLNYNDKSLAVRWNSGKGFFVQDLFVVECETLEDVMAVVSEGHRNRRVGSHELNKDSSRSHSLLTVHLESTQTHPENKSSFTQSGKITFVDLAGSERLKDSKSEGATLAETGAINKSLFTLSNVISSLSSNKPSFVPYRDSKLTKLLMDSIGGTSKTLLIACCSPSAAFLEETVSTLNYATRAARIKNRPRMQLDERDQLVATLRQTIKLLKAENERLKSTNKSLLEGATHPTSPKQPRIIRSASPRSSIYATIDKTPDSTLVDITTGTNQLRQEKERLSMDCDELRRKFEQAAQESVRLSGKLERLEQVFVHDGNSPWRKHKTLDNNQTSRS